MKKAVAWYLAMCFLFVNAWSIGMTLDRNEGLILEEFNEE